MDIFAFDPATFTSFLLTFVRISLVIFLLPFFGGEYIPPMVKGALCLVLTMALWPKIAFSGELMPAHPLGIGLMLLGEIILGLIMGLCVYFLFAAIQTGGEVMGFQMGFAMLSMADPISGTQSSVTSQVLYMVSLVVFLALDGHLHLLRALVDSFALVPPGGLHVTGQLTEDILSLSADMFSLAVRIAAPAITAILMAELTLALMGRAAPQMNLLTMGFPIKIAVGFFFMGILFTTLSIHLEEFIVEMAPMYHRLMRAGG